MVWQASNQVQTLNYEPQFDSNSKGFSPRCRYPDALQSIQEIVDEGYGYVPDLELALTELYVLLFFEQRIPATEE